jgi:CheY-like chemotaxis protein
MITAKSCARETGLPCTPAAEAGRPPACASLVIRESDLSGSSRDLTASPGTEFVRGQSSGHALRIKDPAHRDRGAILVVDDEPSVLTLLKITLEKSGFRVVVASNGAEALAKFEAMQDQIRVVITDIAMPGMSGLDLIPSIRKFDTAVDIIATTGMATPDQMKEIREAGVRHVLNKPLGPRLILELIRNLFSTP